jgi:hypothetical protein
MTMKDDQFFFICPSNGAPVEWNWQRKTEILGGKTCLSATLSTTNPTWTDPGLNPGLRGGWPLTNCLSQLSFTLGIVQAAIGFVSSLILKAVLLYCYLYSRSYNQIHGLVVGQNSEPDLLWTAMFIVKGSQFYKWPLRILSAYGHIWHWTVSLSINLKVFIKLIKVH